MNIVKRTILFIGVSISLFVSCVHPPPREIVAEPREIVTEPREIVTERPSPRQKTTKTSVSTLTQDWATFIALRRAEGYTLLNVRESKALLKDNSIVLTTGSNHQYNIRTVMTLTTTITTLRVVHVDTVLIVNDDTGNLRVFKK